MDAESFWQGWAFLLSLSKVQLILLGVALALLVAISKILRFLFLLGFVVICLTIVFPAAGEWYDQSRVGTVVNYLLQWGKAATQDPIPAEPPPAIPAEAPAKEKR
ncbi:MAG: hypothetical protein FJ147_20480 [Deltaproteobacteria bacterium]|nr:hypothetical protein [Deltaproteobacteria bacterium]